MYHIKKTEIPSEKSRLVSYINGDGNLSKTFMSKDTYTIASFLPRSFTGVPDLLEDILLSGTWSVESI